MRSNDVVSCVASAFDASLSKRPPQPAPWFAPARMSRRLSVTSCPSAAYSAQFARHEALCFQEKPVAFFAFMGGYRCAKFGCVEIAPCAGPRTELTRR